MITGLSYPCHEMQSLVLVILVMFRGCPKVSSLTFTDHYGFKLADNAEDIEDDHDSFFDPDNASHSSTSSDDNSDPDDNFGHPNDDFGQPLLDQPTGVNDN